MRTGNSPKTSHGFLNFIMKSRIRSEDVKLPELAFGYFLGPFGALITNALFVSFLNRFYTDILGMKGTFITLLPLVSTVFVVIGNLVMGIVMDKTKTPAGKARPFLLISAPLMLVSIVLIFSVPTGNEILMMVWVAISYNLFFAIAYPTYFVAHSMMIPLSTRNSDQRGRLSVASQVANLGSTGLFATMLFPMLFYPKLKNRSAWLICMCIVGAVACAGIILEFCFTRERVTEETLDVREKKDDKVPAIKQLKAVVSDKCWWMIILFYLFFNLAAAFKNLSMSYYCDYILGSYQDGITQTVVAAISGIPIAAGVIFAWPLAKKFGKKNSIAAGLFLSVAGGLFAMTAMDSFGIVVSGVFIKTLGTIPACYVMMALFSDVLDHLEAKNGFRCDGLSMSLYSVIMVGASGIVTAVFNGLISMSGYVAPSVVDGVMVAATQNNSTRWVIALCFLGAETVANGVLGIMMIFCDVEKHIEEDQKIIKERKLLTAFGKRC